jgi:hypothetical protein
MTRAFFVVLTLFAAMPAFANDVSFVRVWPQWRKADDFDRIREYFGGPENDGRETVLRTHADQRAGLYFLVRVKAAQPIEGGRFVLNVVRPDSPDPREYTFPVSLPAKSHVAELGLTDGDWPHGRDVHPVAWKLSLLDRDGRVLASEQSFLWQDPAQ